MSPSPKDDSMLMRQKLIHYKSELKNYENQIRQLERALDREKENSLFWKNKHAEAYSINDKDTELEELEKELYQLKNEYSEQAIIIESLKERISRKQPIIEEKVVEKIIEKPVEKVVEKRVEVKVDRFQATDVISYFQHSVLMPTPDEEEMMILGTAVVMNQTGKPLVSPVICLKVKPQENVSLTGKVVDESEIEASNLPASALQWQYAHPKWREKIKQDGEYWIRPTRSAQLVPNQPMRFESFQLLIPKELSESFVIVEGYFYSEEWKQGIPFLNKIVLSLPTEE
ncbi:hypothetical protein MHL30_14430 [Priestia flexa]|uniref:hypothetical protein n=1 Tax=Priestia flexa TaxID=86664 RepID=UPI001EF3D6CE|nr:hypothetical protein [Priestia flexa]MCG7314347.1 hypothetical protein [Priestia flexa]